VRPGRERGAPGTWLDCELGQAGTASVLFLAEPTSKLGNSRSPGLLEG
jgi:hypothetical protein